MKQTLLALTTLLFLSACANTRDGIQQDARRMGDKTQAISQILMEP